MPEDIDKEIINIIENQDKNSKQIIYKLLNAAFSTIG